MTSYIPLSTILVEARQRTTFDAVKLNDLRNSLRQRRRLLNAIIVEPLTEDAAPFTHRLICGERRMRAMQTMHEEKLEIRYDAITIPRDCIAAVSISDLSLIDRLRSEFDENVIRDDLTWQDRDRALFTMHQAELTINPDTTITAMAEELVAKGVVKAVSTGRTQIGNAIIVAQHLHDPVVANARTSLEAFNIIMQREEAEINAELLRRQRPNIAETTSIRIICGDAFEQIPLLDAESFDLICSDPPYGVGAGAAGFRGRTVHHHNYSDTVADGLAAMQLLLVAGWRVAKLTSNIFIFADINNWDFFKQQSASMGWKPFPVPIIWRKSQSEGLAPWGRGGFRRTYEAIFFATKGPRGLISSPVDVLEVRRVHRSERIYGAQKPVDLLMQLIDSATLPGQSVLDPFCGSGATLAGAKRLKRTGVGIEQDAKVCDIATNFIFKGEIEDLQLGNDSDGRTAEHSTPATSILSLNV